MKESNLKSHDILLFNLLLNVGDLSNIKNNKINIPKPLCNEKKNYYFKKELLIINKAIDDNKKIRIWTSHYNIYSYLIMLLVCYVIYKRNYTLYVTYSDEYSKDCVSPSMMKSLELEKLATLEHKLTKKEIINFSNMWENIIKNNAEMRILENNVVKSVSINYYDSMILNKLKTLGQIKVSKLVGLLINEVYLTDSLYTYFIKRLIKENKIKIIKQKKKIFFDNIIEIN